jgi:hypothetical protein
MTNSNKICIKYLFKVQKTFDNGLFASLAYNYLVAKDVNSIELKLLDAFCI